MTGNDCTLGGKFVRRLVGLTSTVLMTVSTTPWSSHFLHPTIPEPKSRQPNQTTDSLTRMKQVLNGRRIKLMQLSEGRRINQPLFIVLQIIGSYALDRWDFPTWLWATDRNPKRRIRDRLDPDLRPLSRLQFTTLIPKQPPVEARPWRLQRRSELQAQQSASPLPSTRLTLSEPHIAGGRKSRRIRLLRLNQLCVRPRAYFHPENFV